MYIYKFNAGLESINYIIEKIINNSCNIRNRHIIITPDQFNAELQENLLKKSCNGAFLNIEVLSFKSIAQQILKETLNESIVFSEIETELGIRRVLIENNSKFKFFKNKYSDDGFISNLKKILFDFESSEKIIAELFNLSVDDTLLNDKLEEIKLFIKLYRELLGNEKSISVKLLDNACINVYEWIEILKKRYDKIEINFLGFNTFTLSQLEFIKAVSSNLDDVNFYFTCFDSHIKYDVYNLSYETINKLIFLAKKENIPVYSEDIRFKNNDMIFFANNIYSHLSFEKRDVECIKLIEAKNIKNEIEQACREIHRLVEVDKQYSYSDIILFVGSLDENIELIKKNLNRYGIRSYIDFKQSLHNTPIVKLLKAILEIIYYGKKTKNIIKLIKFGYFNKSYLHTAKLENELLAKSKIYYKETDSSDYIEDFEKISKTLDIVKNMKNTYLIGKLIESIKEIFNLYSVEENINNTVDILLQSGEIIMAQQYAQLFELLQEALATMNNMFVGVDTDCILCIKLLINIIENMKLGTIPQGVDEILVANPAHTMICERKVAFIIGANDNKFINTSSDDSFFSKSELDMLSKYNPLFNEVSVSSDSVKKLTFVDSISKIKEKIYISYSKMSLNNEALYKDIIVKRFEKIFNYNYLKLSDSLDKIIDTEDMYNEVVSIRDNKTLYSNILNLLSKDTRYLNEANTLLRVLNDKQVNLNKEYITDTAFSISKLEKYNSCPFSYFMSYIMKVKERREYEVSALDLGIIRHYIVENYFRINKNNLSLNVEEISERINYILGMQKNTLYTINDNRTKFVVDTLRKGLVKAIYYISDELMRNSFRIYDLEKEFKKIEKIYDRNVVLEGKIDRIDIFEENQALRIVDYKSSNKVFDEKLIKYGLMLQLPFYASAIEDDKRKSVALNYINISNYTPTKKNDKFNLNDEYRKQYGGNILYLEDDGIGIKADKDFYSKVVAKNREEFEELLSSSRVNINESIKSIFNGYMPPRPYKLGENCGCDYCAYKRVCGFDKKDKRYKYNNIGE